MNLQKLDEAEDPLNHVTSYTYDDAGRLTGTLNFNGTTTEYGYDNADRLTSLQNKKTDATTISTYAYTLDANGNRTRIEKQEPLIANIPASTTNYSYNPEKNRLTTINTTPLTYDNEGQLQTKGADNYTFDLAHRLKTVSGSTTAQYTYDGQGNRLQAVRNGVTTRYVYDLAGNLLAETDAANTVTRYYIHGAGLLATIDTADNIHTYHYNGNGNTIAITNQSQEIVNKYTYTPYGKITEEQETIPQLFKFAGQYGIIQEPTGTYYMRARYYDPESGKFISEDPSGFVDGVNLYEYARNNPVLYLDSTGKAAHILIASAIGGIAGVVNAHLNGTDPLIGAAVGGMAGAITGLTFGAGSTVAIGGMAAMSGNVASQVADNYVNIEPLSQINYVSAGLSGAAGATGSALGLSMSGLAQYTAFDAATGAGVTTGFLETVATSTMQGIGSK